MALPSASPKSRLRARVFSVVGATIIGLGALAYILPLLSDLITDWRFGPTQPTAGARVVGGCSLRIFLASCEATLSAPTPGGPEARRKVDYLFLSVDPSDREVVILADRARPDRLTTDIGQDRLWNRTLLMLLLGPLCLVIGVGALLLGFVTLVAPGKRQGAAAAPEARYFVRTDDGGEPTALYRVTPGQGLGEVRRGGEWSRSDDVYRRFVNGFDADVEQIPADGVARAVAALDARAVRAGGT